MSREPIYHETCLTASDNPQQTFYNCRCMLSMLSSQNLSESQMSEEAEVGFGLILHQIQLALDDIDKRYDFVEKSANVSALG